MRSTVLWRYGLRLTLGVGAAMVFVVGDAVPAAADNKRLNDDVAANVFTVQRHAGCGTDADDFVLDPRLTLAAQWHTDDLMADRGLDGDVGSDGTLPQHRATAAGFVGTVAETVAINPAMSINGLDVMKMWFADPHALAIMRDCRFTRMGVWSENSLDRTVLVAMYGQPE